MAYDEGTAERLRELLIDHPEVVELKMFGGLVFMIYGHMSIGVEQHSIMVRVGPEQYAEVLKKLHAREMDFTGKPLKGFIYVDEKGFESDQQLAAWLQRSLNFVTSLPPK